MSLGTDYVSTENRVATSDPRFDMRLTENFNDDDASGSGWTWVAAILLAGVLIVSGYLEQESANVGSTSSAPTIGERYASNTSAPQTRVADTHKTDKRSDKGY